MTRGVDWIRKRGDTYPPISHQLGDGAGGVINLGTATSVDAIFYREEEQAEVLQVTTTVTHPQEGRIQFPTPSVITNTAALYSIEFLILWPGPVEQRVPAAASTDHRYLLVRCDRAAPAFPAVPFTLVDLSSVPTALMDDAQLFTVTGMAAAQTFTHTRSTTQPNVWFVGTVLGETTVRYVTNIPITYPATNQVTVDPGLLAPLTGTFYVD